MKTFPPDSQPQDFFPQEEGREKRERERERERRAEEREAMVESSVAILG